MSKSFVRNCQILFDFHSVARFSLNIDLYIYVENSDGDNEEKPVEEPAGPKITVADFYGKGDWPGLFDFIDVNGDGSLSWHEFLNVDGIKDCTDLMAKVTTFRDADADGDDKVTKEEFISHMSE